MRVQRVLPYFSIDFRLIKRWEDKETGKIKG